ncbi:MAG: gliding motility-associated C-terminal domain-containing protein, partial [Chitinophagales bacterium]|nr:gliding motility-associated C-terminal domain-containing protein [Chitinophagales bacterium]
LLSYQPGIYSVIVTNDLGCAASDSILISDVICDQIFLPIAFSPNNDGTNDVYHILNADDVATLDFNIYNRWGQLIFTTNDGAIGWNGQYKNQDCELGVYIFVLNGVLNNGISVSMKGNVTLVR